MKHLPHSLALALAFSGAAAHAQTLSPLELLPANMCLVTPQGLATIYHQHQDEGIFAPYLESRAALTGEPTGLKSLIPLVKVSGPQLAKGLTGTFEAPAGEFNSKTKTWEQKPGAYIKVQVTGWEGDRPLGRCEGKSTHGMAGFIVPNSAYYPVVPGSAFMRHKLVPDSDIPYELYKPPVRTP